MRQKKITDEQLDRLEALLDRPFSTKRRCASTRKRSNGPAAPSPAVPIPRPTGCRRSSAAKPGSTPTPGAKAAPPLLRVLADELRIGSPTKTR